MMVQPSLMIAALDRSLAARRTSGIRGAASTVSLEALLRRGQAPGQTVNERPSLPDPRLEESDEEVQAWLCEAYLTGSQKYVPE